jgi:hypothetical protein
MAYVMNHCQPHCGQPGAPRSLHVCNLAAQTGVTRFQEQQPNLV